MTGVDELERCDAQGVQHVDALRAVAHRRAQDLDGVVGAALVDTATEVTSGIAVTILAALFTGDIATSNWSTLQTAQFQEAVMIAGLALTGLAAALVTWGIARAAAAGAEIRWTPSEHPSAP